MCITAACAMISTSGCSDYLDVNTNVDAPDFIAAHLYLPGILATAQYAYYDIRPLGPMAQMMGTSSYTTAAQYGYSLADDGTQMWYSVYWQMGMNLENMVKQAIADEAWTLAGIGLAYKAWGWDLLTKYHGDLPMTDAFVPGLLQHRYDYQDVIYEQIRAWAKEAIEYLEKPDNFGYGKTLQDGDLIFGGNKAKWIKFAHGIIVRNLASLTNKKDFATKYAPELISHAALALQTTDDDVTCKTLGGGSSALYSMYNCFWGTARANLTNSYWQHDFAVQTFTGTVPQYDPLTKQKVRVPPDPITGVAPNPYYPFELLPKQIICDTVKSMPGHFDPRVVLKLATEDDPYYADIANTQNIKQRRYYGSGFTGSTGPIGNAPNFFGRREVSSVANDGIGRWIYRNDAPYILMTAAELKFCLAETYFKIGRTADAFSTWKEGVALDIRFTEKYIYPGSFRDGFVGGGLPGGDKITKAVFNTLANEYLNGPFVGQLPQSEFSLSHIMMQKYVALYPWGAAEAWVDLRKYHYDIVYSGDYPSYNNGWIDTEVTIKWDTDPTKVFKGFYLMPAMVESRTTRYGYRNEGSPGYRYRPRYNSEYMWNQPSLEQLKPIAGTADNYHCSIPWFAYPGDYPSN